MSNEFEPMKPTHKHQPLSPSEREKLAIFLAGLVVGTLATFAAAAIARVLG